MHVLHYLVKIGMSKLLLVFVSFWLSGVKNLRAMNTCLQINCTI